MGYRKLFCNSEQINALSGCEPLWSVAEHLVEDKITADSSCPGNMAHVIVQT